METLYKTFRAELKGIEEDGSLNMFIPVSTSSMDRDGEVIDPTAFRKTIPKFMKHPVLVASHDYRDLTNQIGEWTKLKITADGIEGKPKYYVGMGNEQADWAYKLAQKGVAAFSIGFIPTKWEDGDGVKSARRTYQEVELLEISQVIIPSNRDAIMGMRSKGVDPIVNAILDEVEKSDLITKPEVTEEYVRVPVDTGNHEGHKIRTIDISAKEGISALYCVQDKVVTTYLFSKDKGWDMTKAKQWVKDNEKKSLEHEISQEEIIDELDYIIRLLDTKGMNGGTLKDAWKLVREVLRIAGDEIPEDIKAKFSTVKEIMIVETKPEEKITNIDILESIKRISGGK